MPKTKKKAAPDQGIDVWSPDFKGVSRDSIVGEIDRIIAEHPGAILSAVVSISFPKIEDKSVDRETFVTGCWGVKPALETINDVAGVLEENVPGLADTMEIMSIFR
jgi:hypothetical protein